MKLMKKTEMSPLESLRREMDRLFDDITPFRWRMENGDNELELWAPNSDMTETDKAFTITVDLPGISKKDVDISFKDNRLTVKGERETEEKKEEKDYIRRERYVGKFLRSFTLPGEVQEDQIKAAFKEGVLTVTVPKAETSKPTMIDID